MALIQCPDCGKEFSDSAKRCPNCGYMHKEPENFNHSLIGGWIVTVVGLLFAASVTFNLLLNPQESYDSPVVNIIMLIFGIAVFIIGCFLISGQYGKITNKISYIVGGGILITNIIIISINYNSTATKIANRNSQNATETLAPKTEIKNPNTLAYYIGTWEYKQPNNQDGVKSIKFFVNDDETVQAIVNKNGKEIIVYGSYNYYKSYPNQISMHFDDTEEHVNGLLYIDHLRVFKGFNDYFGIKYGIIKHENDGTVYLYEGSSYADSKNPNKRVEITKIN